MALKHIKHYVPLAIREEEEGSEQVTHLVQEMELRYVGDLSVQQLVGNVEDPLLDRQLDRDTEGHWIYHVTQLRSADHILLCSGQICS